MNPQEKEPTEVAVAVVVSGGHVLLTRRKPQSHLEGMWEFPGGKVREGEEPSLCAVREVEEECGIAVCPQALLHHELYRYPDRELELFFYLCRPMYGEPPETASAGHWVPLKDLPHYSFPAANAPVLEKLATAPHEYGAGEEALL